MNLAAWRTLDDDGRRVTLDGLLEQLPSWLELVQAGPQPRFRDRRSGEGWRLFAEGEVTLGATPERLAEVARFVQSDPLALFDAEVFQPHRTVQVSPFLLMEGPLLEGDEPRYFFMDVKKEQREALEARGLRLPTEAEWELAWWAVQASPEHWVAGSSELCADGWRADYVQHTGVDPCVPGGPSVVRSASFDRRSLDSVMPPRQPLSGTRLVTIRPALDLPLRLA